MIDKLYYVKTVVHEYDEHNKNVPFIWFKVDDARSICDPEHLRKRLFTEDEARQLKEFLDRKYGHDGIAEIQMADNVEAVLPVPGKDQYQSVWSLFEARDYSLPFKAMACFAMAFTRHGKTFTEVEEFRPRDLLRACYDAKRHLSEFTVFELYYAIEEMREMCKLFDQEFAKREKIAAQAEPAS
jgi:hypothetical protein